MELEQDYTKQELTPEEKFIIQQRKRLKFIGVSFMLISILLLGRLFYIQVIKSQEYSRKAVQQRMVMIPVSINRGEIYDRNMISLTNREIKKVIVVYPAYVTNKSFTAETIAKACGMDVETVKRKLSGNMGTLEFIAEDQDNEYLSIIESGMIKGCIAVEKSQRYTDDSIARHIIGYIGKSDKIGQMGIEKSMNSFLAGNGFDSVAAVVDSSKKLIPGLGFRKVEASDNGNGYSIKLTLDYHIQKIVEEVMKKNNINGSVVVMDVTNGDILAMASHPDYEQNNLNKYMNSGGDELINKSIWQFDFGSIFKTVVAAAALENDLLDPEELYACEGSIQVGTSEINCSTYEKTHKDREINFTEAFALSCNTTLIKTGMKVGADKILEMAYRLGLGQKQTIVLPEEKPGYLPTAQEEGIGNISIGQGKIQVTPLQATAMMATIANNGIRYSPNLATELVSEKGITIRKMDPSKPEVVMKPQTAEKLKELLGEVTKTGTGKQANLDDYGGSGGKTSTAQTGIRNGGDVVHGWFSGFFPYNAPKYAVTVFIYNGQSGGGSAAPIFKEIAVNILENANR